MNKGEESEPRREPEPPTEPGDPPDDEARNTGGVVLVGDLRRLGCVSARERAALICACAATAAAAPLALVAPPRPRPTAPLALVLGTPPLQMAKASLGVVGDFLAPPVCVTSVAVDAIAHVEGS